MKNRAVLEQGAMVAIGVFLANAMFFPLIGEESLARGLRKGVITAGLVLVAYLAIALLRPAKRDAGAVERQGVPRD
ncbi:MAG: hypothetical protein IPG61_09630 [bacterium]|nr:hypothetical protein [bacterium]